MRGTIAGEILNNDANTVVDQTVSRLVNAYIRDHCNSVNPDFYSEYKIDPKIRPCDSMVTLKDIESYVETNLSTDQRGANGVVFTPQYIVQYILNSIMVNSGMKILDPSCGCGSFLIETVTTIAEKSKTSYREIIETNIYGLDIVPKFIETAKLLLALSCLSKGEDPIGIKFNLKCTNSLDIDWRKTFNTDGFEAIIGNPPYSNAHDLDESMAVFIKNHFKTTKKGTSNIFYAFVEKGMENLSPNGQLGFIIPNNYLTITAAQPLRKMLKESRMIEKIVDFNDNMVFAPIRTYNSLLFLRNSRNIDFEYAVMDRTSDIEHSLNNLSFNKMNMDSLEDSGWKLLPKETYERIHVIESYSKTIKKYIHTGIATLRDDLYIVDYFDEMSGYYVKQHDGNEYHIESGVVRDLYKISDIKVEEDIQKAVKHIICPYTVTNQAKLDGSTTRMSKIISENVMKTKYPLCYNYFCAIRTELDKRDAGRGAAPIWYAYGRTQSLNYIGRKLIFPTFSSKPKFMMLEDEEALFCNGYVIVEDSSISLELLQKIINSDVMDYYVSSTSYPIEGGYYCYQKKFIQNFSIPPLSEEEIEMILKSDQPTVNSILHSKYSVPLNM